MQQKVFIFLYFMLSRCKGLLWPPVSHGRRPFGVGSGGRCSAHRPCRPRLKLPTQSQMANDHILKFDILKFQFKAKFTVIHLWPSAWSYTRCTCSQFLHHTCQSNALCTHAFSAHADLILTVLRSWSKWRVRWKRQKFLSGNMS